MVRARRFRLSVLSDLALGQFHVESRPTIGGDALVAEKVLIGAFVGGEIAWYPSLRLPLALETSIALGGLRPVVNEGVVDGYEPFDGGLSARRIRAGLSWRVP